MPVAYRDYYEALGLPRGASSEEIRRAYKRQREIFREGGLPVEGAGDGSLFKGILARYLGDLVGADPDASQRVRAALASSGTAVAAAAGGPIGIDWRHPATSEVGLGSEVSGALLLEALARLERPM